MESDPRARSTTAWHRHFLDPKEGLSTGRTHRVTLRKEAIPIIFVPGIMGTRLKSASGAKIWDPDAMLWMLFQYGMKWVGPRTKKRRMIGRTVFDEEYLQPYNDDARHNAKHFGERHPHGAERGWGSVSWYFYGRILEAMSDATWGDEIATCFELPVYGFGTNWAASCGHSGELLASRIDEIINDLDGQKFRCSQVILVTHSQGSIVARAACGLYGAADKVLHAIHGVQPTTGSAAAYWRMKAGFERVAIPKDPNSVLSRSMASAQARVTAWVLGTDGREVTAILANMPGALELLPTMDYRVPDELSDDGDTKAGWLNLVLPNGRHKALPDGDPPDPYAQIYRSEGEYWSFIERGWLPSVGKSADAWESYLANLKQAEDFRSRLRLWRHAATSTFSSKGLATSATPSFKTKPVRFSPLYQPVPTCRGSYSVYLTLGDNPEQVPPGFVGDALEVTLQQPQEDGDQTVPILSARALEAQGDNQEDHRLLTRVTHSTAFNDDDAIAFTLEAIRRACRRRLGVIDDR